MPKSDSIALLAGKRIAKTQHSAKLALIELNEKTFPIAKYFQIVPVVTPIREGTAPWHCPRRSIAEQRTIQSAPNQNAWPPNLVFTTNDKNGLFLRAQMQRIGEYFMFGQLKAVLAGLAVWATLHAAIDPAFAQDGPAVSPDQVGSSPPARKYRYANAPSETPRPNRYAAKQASANSAPPANYRYSSNELPPPNAGGNMPAPVNDGMSNVVPGNDPFGDDGMAPRGGPVPRGRVIQDGPMGQTGPMNHDPLWDEADGSPWMGCDAHCGQCCGPVYVRAEYLAWWMKGESLPALVTTSTTGTSRADAGVLGLPSTSVAFGGGNSFNSSMRSGGRIVLGWWLDPTARVEAEFFGLGTQQASYDATSAGTPILARPFFNVPNGAQDANVIAYPGQLSGSVHATASSGSFLGAGVHATQNLTFTDFGCDRQRRVDFLYGFRYLRLQEGLSENDSITATSSAGTVPVGANIMTTDNFRTTNNFYGLNLGMMSECRASRWCLTSIGRIGVGATTEHITINGNTTVTPAGGTPTNSAGGLLALPSNIGSYQHAGFAVVPQLELKLAYDLTPRLRVNVGYDIIYWSRVARPGDQVSPYLNTSQASGQPLVGAAAPQFTLRETDLWVQGVSVGGEWRF